MIDLEVRKGLKKGPYVEFNISGNERRYRHWEDESLFLYEAVFSIFADAFDRSVKHFNYYGHTQYRYDDLLKLRRELGSIDSRLAAIVDMEHFIEAVIELAHHGVLVKELGEVYELTTEWDMILSLLRNVSRSLLDLVNQSIHEGRVLWVLGI